MSDLSRRTFLASTAGALSFTACSTATPRRVAAESWRFDRDRFIGEVKQALPQGQGAVEEVVARAVSEPTSVLSEVGAPTQAGIQPLYRDESLSILNIVWPPLAVLVPHNHLMWATIGVYAGRENNVVWRRSGATIEPVDAATVARTDVFSLPRDAIHSVTNPIESYTAAIHVYGGDLPAAKLSQWDPLTLREEPFDVEEGRRILREADQRFGERRG